MAEEASRSFSLTLQRAGTDLSYASHRLKSLFSENELHGDNGAKSETHNPYNNNNNKNNSEEEEVLLVDPVTLVKRLSALEVELSTLQEQCEFVEKHRSELVRRTREALVRNTKEIYELSIRSGMDATSLEECDETLFSSMDMSCEELQTHKYQNNHTNDLDADLDKSANTSVEQKEWASRVVAAERIRKP